MSVDFKNIGVEFTSRGLEIPTLTVLEPDGQLYDVLAIQPTGEIAVTDGFIGHANREAGQHRFEGFLAMACSTNCALALAPEYSCPWSVLEKVIAAGRLPQTGRLWILGCEGIAPAELKKVIARSPGVEWVHEPIPTETGSVLGVLAYITQTQTNAGQPRCVVVLQFKTQAMGGEPGERDLLIPGRAVYIWQNVPEYIRLISMICADSLGFNQALHQKCRCDIDPTIIFHPQLTADPLHTAMCAYRDGLYLQGTTQGLEVISLNWARGFAIPGKQPNAYGASAIYTKAPQLDTSDTRVNGNHKLGLYFTNWKTHRTKLFFFNFNEHVFYFRMPKVSQRGPGVLTQRTGPEMRSLWQWDASQSKWAPLTLAVDGFEELCGEYDDGHGDFCLGDGFSHLDRERLLVLSAGRFEPSQNWYKVEQLESFTSENDERCKRLTFTHEQVNGSRMFRQVHTAAELEQNREALWWMGRVSPANVEREMDAVSNALQEIETLRKEVNKNATALERARIRLTRCEAELSVLTRLREYHAEANAMSLRGSTKALEEASTRVSRLQEATRLLRQIDMSPYAAVPLTPAALAQQQNAEVREAQRNLHTLQARLQPLQVRLGQMNALIQEIKGLGRRFCHISPHSEDCPLCGAHYDDLSIRLETLEITAPVEESLRDLTEQVAQGQQRLRKAERAVETFATVLRAGELVLGQEKAATCQVERLVNGLENLSDALLTARANQSELSVLVTRMKLAGFDEEELEELIGVAHEEYSLPLTKLTNKDSLLSLFNERTSQEEELQKARRDAERAAGQLHTKIEQIRIRCFRDAEIEDRDLELDRRKEALEDVVEQLKEIKKRLVIADDDGFATVEKRLRTFSKAVERTQQAFRAIEEKDTLEQQLTSASRQAEIEVARLTPRQVKAKKAVELLERLTGDDYKEKYLRQLRADHSDKISKIFCHIHAPHEFKAVALDENVTLKRLNGTTSQVSEISAGQRAALALSIFLSLNSSVTPRAPWLLFDDPVVHVDDLNILSFFDMLRELVLLDDRQLFFATANSRIADLFAKKFDFFGSDFRQIHIKR